MRRTRDAAAIVVLVGLFALAMSPSVDAQDGSGTPQIEDRASDPCAAAPEGDDEQADGETQLSGRLDRCGSVLTPPKTGDGEIVEPAPDTGRTPVIPPEAVPPTD
ncbi:MAG: hypothetical protein AB7L41_12675 [Flavobacteriaceae bacterium]